jgi:hypothetical protein
VDARIKVRAWREPGPRRLDDDLVQRPGRVVRHDDRYRSPAYAEEKATSRVKIAADAIQSERTKLQVD